MDNSSIIISIVIVLCIAAGVTAYGLTNDSNTVFNDLSGFTPDEQGNTGIGNNSTGLEGANSGTGTGTSSGSGTGSSSSSSSSSSSEKHNVSPEKAKKIAEGAGWEGSWCYSVEYNSGGYYTCLLKDKKGNTGYVLVGSGTGKILEGAWSGEVEPDDDDKNSTESGKDNTTKNSTDTKKSTNQTDEEDEWTFKKLN